MMKKLNIVKSLVAVAALALASCASDWDDHYGQSSAVPDKSLMEMLQADADLQTFVRMLEISGYNEMLASSQTFTVFAPTNEALAGVDLEDKAAVSRIVLNHISRFSNSTSTQAETGVKMYNGKRFFFSGNTFGHAAIERGDIIARNGVLHVLSSQIPYAYNLREYIDSHENTSLIREFLARFDRPVMDIEASRPIGVDANGATVYDSVMVPYNPILQHTVTGLGDIASEDSVFTMIIPTDDAWRSAYDLISEYFNVYNADKAVADSIAELQTSLAIVNDLVYRSYIDSPASRPVVVSTSGSEITDPASLFAGTEKIDASNGIIYLASTLNYDNTLTWNKQIDVEAEEQSGRTPAAGSTIYTRTVSDSQAHASEISGMRYIDVVGTSSSRNPGVTFSIPDVLSGEYEIYMTFVPAVTADPTVTTESTRLQFTLTYMDTNGRTKTQAFKSDDYLTDPLEMTMMKVGNFKFPVSDYCDRLWLSTDGNDPASIVPTTKLYVVTNVSNSEFNSNKLARQFRVDQIIFIPVKK